MGEKRTQSRNFRAEQVDRGVVEAVAGDQQVVGVEGGDGQKADPRRGEGGGCRGHDTDDVEAERPADAEEPESALVSHVGRDGGLRADHGKLVGRSCDRDEGAHGPGGDGRDGREAADGVRTVERVQRQGVGRRDAHREQGTCCGVEGTREDTDAPARAGASMCVVEGWR